MRKAAGGSSPTISRLGSHLYTGLAASNMKLRRNDRWQEIRT